NVFSRFTTGVGGVPGTRTRRSRPFFWPSYGGSTRKPTTIWYLPTSRLSCASARVGSAISAEHTNASATTNTVQRCDMRYLPKLYAQLRAGRCLSWPSISVIEELPARGRGQDLSGWLNITGCRRRQ